MNRPAQTIALVARREFVTRVRTKAFIISNAIILVAILGGILAASIFSGGSDAHQKVGLVGSAESLAKPLAATAAATGNPVDTSALPDEAAARAKVDSGALDVALIPRAGTSYTAVVKKDLSKTLQSTLDAAVRQQAVNAALAAKGVDPTTLAQTAAQANITVDATKPPNPNADQRTALAYIALFLMYFQILMFGIYVAMGVVEEKTSRVVEVLLATIKPLHLLCGKIVGIGAVGLVQLAAYGVVGLAAGLGTGLVTVTATAVGVFASVLGWFILGFTFFAVIYAAAGSLVSRQEDVNAATAPITVLILATFFVAQSSVKSPDGTLATVASWIPPFSAMLMPLRIAAGTTDAAQVIGSVLVMVAVTVVLALVAARIYERSVLRTGRRVSWREAVGAGA